MDDKQRLDNAKRELDSNAHGAAAKLLGASQTDVQQVRDVARQAQDTAQRRADAIASYVQAQPLTTLLIALLSGFVLGVIASRT